MEWFASTSRLVALAPLMIATLCIVRRILQGRVERKGLPFPPGPTPLPFLGNVLSVNTQVPWLTYTEWREKYGDIMYVRLLNTDVVVLGSTSVATDLLEKRSGIYSDRPFIASVAPYGHDFNFIFSQYGERWRLCRRIFQQTFRADAAFGFRSMQLRRARELILNMIDDTNEYPFHFATFASSVSMSAVYDYEPSARNDPMVSIVDKYLQAAVPGIAPGRTVLLTVFPFLLHLPDWFPGSWIKREARAACAWRNKMVETPYQYVRKRMESKECMNAAMVSDHITRMEKLDDHSHRSEYETALKQASATASIVSAETTSSTLMTFTLAMVLNPHVWKRAQEEIDTVVGTHRLPEWDDRPSLTYVDAIVRETFRWRPVIPLVMHAVTCNDIYQGYYIPKGATVVVNSWAVSRDEVRYPAAETFLPERFLDAEGMLTGDHPCEFIFGFGRRKCPGRYSADASVWSAIATMLATLDFNLARDADGNDITFEATFTNGITDHPNPFPCQLTPRPHVSKEMLDCILAK